MSDHIGKTPDKCDQKTGLLDDSEIMREDSLLMNQMVAMVTEKKVSGSMGTRTRAAVTEKRRRMATRLKATRMRSFTLRRGKITTPSPSSWWPARGFEPKQSCVRSPLVQEGVEQRERQQGQLGEQGHPAVIVVVLGGAVVCDVGGAVGSDVGDREALVEILRTKRKSVSWFSSLIHSPRAQF